MPDSERLKELAFDFYERYILLEPIGNLFRPQGSPYKVLDVGGCTPVFWPGFPSMAAHLIPNAAVAVVDLIPDSGLRNYVRASGLQLPFADGTFDLVCSLDTLEHLPRENRAGFLSELLRVSRDGVYIVFPFDSPGNRWAESVVVEYTEVLLKEPVPALLEHRQFGLPDRREASSVLADGPWPFINFDQGNTDLWLLMMLTYHSLRIAGTDFVQELNQRFNRVYATQDWAAPAYRTGYVLSKRKSLADLEALRASFVRTGDHAEMQGVLAMCQLFLNIAQNGRVVVDKDRHIHNIEQQREALIHEADRLRAEIERKTLENRELSANLSRITSQLEEVRNQLRDFQGQLGGFQSHLDNVQNRTSELRNTVKDLECRSAQARVSNLEMQVRLDARMRDLEIGLVTNKRATQAIYDSRIWKSLRAVGGLALRWTGRNTHQQPAWPASAPKGGAIQRRTVTDEFMALVSDYPDTACILPVRGVVEIRGWALATSGIDRVLIQINDDPPALASYGIPRHDVARSHPKIDGADHSGYRYFWDTAGLPEGRCIVRVTAVSRSGETRETASTVTIDWKTPPDYGLWIARNEPSAEAQRRMRLDVARFPVRPRISIAVPVYKTPLPVLARCIESVTGQIYPDWELCLADDASEDPAITVLLQDYAQRDSRIRVNMLPRNHGISGATNEALASCSGEYVAFLDHDDELAPFALFEVINAINEAPDTDLFYSDEDKIDEQGRRYDAFFKPDWSPDLFRSCNYICHFVVMKRSLLDRLDLLNESYSGSQDYEFLLRVSEHTQKIQRIPKILYHWRAISGSAAIAPAEKPKASEHGRRALVSYLDRNSGGATVEEVGACRYRVRYPILGGPQVTILIPTGGHKNVFRAMEDVLEKTSYKNYEVLLIDNSRSPRVAEYVERLAARKLPVRSLDWRGKPFNFSSMNNEAARKTASPYILFLNDDTSIITPDWLSAMLEHAQQPKIGAVGAQLWYPNNLIQHAGVVMGIYGNCSHAFKGLPGGGPHYFGLPNLIRNCSAVTAACMLIARDKFFEVGGFDEINLAVAFQDVDLCLKLLERGYRNVYTPYARLYHYESATKTEEDKIPDPAEDNFMKKKWAKYIANDPYYNPNLTRRSEDFALAIE
jgi:glycosyltransferase involved in cell wall biosynthesis